MPRDTHEAPLEPGGAGRRGARGRQREGASFPAPPAKFRLPASYAAAVSEIKRRIGTQRLGVVLAANEALVLLYWDVGQAILERQQRSGWGARIIDRLSHDLRAAFPEMRGLSARNLKYMRAFAAAWPDRSIVQQAAAQIPWSHNVILLNKLKDARLRGFAKPMGVAESCGAACRPSKRSKQS